MRIVQEGEDEKRREDESSGRPLQCAIMLTALPDTAPKMIVLRISDHMGYRLCTDMESI